MDFPIPGQDVAAKKARIKTRFFASKLDDFMFRSWMLTLGDAPSEKGVDVEARKAKKTLEKLLHLRMGYVCYEYDSSVSGGVKQVYQFPYSASATRLAIHEFKFRYAHDQERAAKWMEKITKLLTVVRERYPDLPWDDENEIIDPIEDEEYESLCVRDSCAGSL